MRWVLFAVAARYVTVERVSVGRGAGFTNYTFCAVAEAGGATEQQFRLLCRCSW